MNILSLFDGISCARVALGKAGIPVDKYYASEVDRYAIKVALKNYPDTIEMGDVRLIKKSDFPEPIDLICGGSPCQDLSIANKERRGLEGERSGLFFEYLRLLKELKPKYFILENVASMGKENSNKISTYIGEATKLSNCLIPDFIEPIMIDAALVSAQRRRRYFWTNIPGVTLPDDRSIILSDILETGAINPKFFLNTSKMKWLNSESGQKRTDKKSLQNDNRSGQYVGYFNKGRQGERAYRADGKSVTLSANGGGRGACSGLYYIDGAVRRLTPIECERLMGLPDHYTEGISDARRYKCLGNGFHCDVIAHILGYFPEGIKK